MGTRGTLHIHKNDLTTPLVSMYFQYDTYPDGLGERLKEMLGNTTIINGYNSQKAPAHFNGVGCMAAYVVGELKFNRYSGKDVDKSESIGNVYITTCDDRQEYNYFLSDLNGKVFLELTDYNEKTLFKGLISEFDSKQIKESDED